MSVTKKIVTSVFDSLRQDEKLLRLLHYPPHDLRGVPEPLSGELANILDLEVEEYWKIVDNHILTSSKADDLQTEEICRIYIYAGTRRRSQNVRVGKQEIVIDVLCGKKYEKDMRLEWLGDYISDSLFLSRLQGGLGKAEYRTGYNFTAPVGYEAYRHIYEIGKAH